MTALATSKITHHFAMNSVKLKLAAPITISTAANNAAINRNKLIISPVLPKPPCYVDCVDTIEYVCLMHSEIALPQGIGLEWPITQQQRGFVPQDKYDFSQHNSPRLPHK